MSKVVNYTVEQEAALKAGYDPKAAQDVRNAQIDKLAADMGKNRRSVIAKLTTMQLYVPLEYVTKQGKAVEKKADVVAFLEKALGSELPGLDAATKKTLDKLRDFVVAHTAQEDAS